MREKAIGAAKDGCDWNTDGQQRERRGELTGNKGGLRANIARYMFQMEGIGKENKRSKEILGQEK